MEIYRFLIVLILLTHPSLSFKLSSEPDFKLNCKYIIIEYNTFNKLIASSSNYLYRLYQFDSKNVKINENYFRIVYNELCLNRTSIRKLKVYLHETNSFLYGIDLSNNNIDNNQFKAVLRAHIEVLDEFNIKLIRYLNLSNNNLTLAADYQLEDFVNLEALILDRNNQLNDLNQMNLNSRLRIVSLNKCNLNEKINLTRNQTNFMSISLIYLGLADNKLTDMTSSNELSSFNLFDNLNSFNIEIIDLSYNRFHKLSTIKYLLKKVGSLRKINLEKNLFSLFDLNEILENEKQRHANIEINLRFNFIRNTSLSYFKLNTSFNPKLSIKLYGNPLVCDCNSMWLLTEASQNKPNRVVKRAIEEISSHHQLDDHAFGMYMQRQKRIKLSNTANTKERSNFSTILISDLDLLKCNFIDVQNYDDDSAYDNEEFGFDSDLKKQNILVKSIKYREKFVIASSYEDFMCYYEDHCRSSDCDCCVFKHCHCRSICPRQCRCYFDSTLKQNIIDCSSLNLIDLPNSSIESATDMRLNSNTLKMLNSHSFFGFGQLKYLYLQNNQISFIAPDSFEDLKYSLKLLNLAENKLNYLNGDEFYGLNELAILVLNGNPLKDIDNINFIGTNHLPSLRFFYLSDTTLPIKKLNELIQYSKKSTNTSIKHQLTTLSRSTNSAITSTNHKNNQVNYPGRENVVNTTNKTRLLSNYFFYQYKLLNW